ncbi:MAG: proton-conducting transporter membrane subunit, partial [Pseudobdellovibrionaceae bacterium]
VVAPLVIRLVFAILLLLLPKQKALQVLFSMTGAALLILCSAELLMDAGVQVQTLQLGGWAAPFGIVLVADRLSAVMCLASSILLFIVIFYSWSRFQKDDYAANSLSLFFFLMMGVTGAFLTGDLFNLYVWYEVLLMASFVLMVVAPNKRKLEGALQYLGLNLISSILFLCAVGILFAVTGKLNMADLAVHFQKTESDNLALLLSIFLFLGFAIKAALFPLFFWLPASYHAPHPAISALFAGLMTKVGVYSILRVMTLIFPEELLILKPYILGIACVGMFVGVFGALAQNQIRRILAIHSVSQMGYILAGVALATVHGAAAAVFFMLHHLFVKASLFLWGGVIEEQGSMNLKDQGGLAKLHPVMAVGFVISAFALAGVPPSSGFFAKLGVIRSAVEQSSFAVVVVGLVVSLITLLSMLKIWNESFLKAPTVSMQKLKWDLPVVLCFSLITIVILFLSLQPESILALSIRIGEDLWQQSNYIEAVLGVRGGL